MKKYLYVLIVFLVCIGFYIFMQRINTVVSNTNITTQKDPVPTSWDGDYYKDEGITWDEEHWRIIDGNIYSVSNENNRSGILGKDIAIASYYNLSCTENECILIDNRSNKEYVFKITRHDDENGEYLTYTTVGNFWGTYKKAASSLVSK